jgi:hypothetical protein
LVYLRRLWTELPIHKKETPYRKKLNPFFFSEMAGWPLTALVIFWIALEISESSSMSEVAVFCIRRTAT